MNEMKWYVLKTISGQESKVKMYIENEVLRSEHLKNNLGQVVVPMEKVVQIRNGKKNPKRESLLSGICDGRS